MADPVLLLQKHRSKGVLLDANLLVMFFVGLVNRRRILSFKRTRQFTPEDFDLLEIVLRWFGRVYVTPHVLSQASDLTDLPGEELLLIRGLFKVAVETRFDETCDPSKLLVGDPVFTQLGLADAAVATVALRGSLVLTTDWDLQGALEKRGADALHFDVIRAVKFAMS